MPVTPIDAILEAFDTHSLVGLSDAHGNEQAHAFLLALIRDPRFPLAANDILVELAAHGIRTWRTGSSEERTCRIRRCVKCGGTRRSRVALQTSPHTKSSSVACVR